MIEKSIVKGLVEEWLEGRDYFLVDVSVSADDRIVVEIDHAEGGMDRRLRGAEPFHREPPEP